MTDGARSSTGARLQWGGLAVLCLVPLVGFSDYVLHLLITILIWGSVYTAWSLMGRFGLVSLGHGAFLGIGAYVVTMLWNHAGSRPGSAFRSPSRSRSRSPSSSATPASGSASRATTSPS